VAGSRLVLKIRPDVLAFYGLIYASALVAMVRAGDVDYQAFSAVAAEQPVSLTYFDTFYRMKQGHQHAHEDAEH
jgi:hypothetical protein